MLQPQYQVSIEKLRANYYRLISQPLPQRAKGVPYEKILGPSAMIGLFLGSILAYSFAPLMQQNPLLFWGAAGILTWFFVVFPAEFYDDRKRTYRHVKSKYPLVFRNLVPLQKKETKEFLFHSLPVLKIDGRKYFLAAYIFQNRWELKPNVRFTGWLLQDALGNIIADDNLFQKAFLTYNYGSLGAAEVQRFDGNEQRPLSNDLHYQLPQAETYLRSQHRYFDQKGQLQDWQNIMDRMPMLYQAGKDALSLYKGRENFRRSMGYSFGLEFEYEDALLEEQMDRTFSKYMQAAYGEQIEAIRASLTRLFQSLENDSGTAGKRLRLDALNKVQKTIGTIFSLIDRMQRGGIPSPEDWSLYRTKLALAKERGFVIVHPLPQAGKSTGEIEG